MENSLYWIWLQSRLGGGNRAVTQLLERQCGARDVFDMSDIQLESLGIFSPRIIERLRDKSTEGAQDALRRCEMLGYTVLTPDDKDYPERLRCIAGPPAAVYVQGGIPNIDNEVCVAIVGTRNASQNGTAAAHELAYRLARAGAVIISGGAKGIDTAAHQGALMAGGKTVAVLGCGIDYRYNMDGRPMRDTISRNGAVISEYPPGTSSHPTNFPVRNRIISALSLGVAVIEAGRRSGSLITANLAAEQGKDIFAVPGNIGDERTLGVNQLIHDGAVPLLSPMDILQEYAYFYPHKLSLEGADSPLLANRRRFDDREPRYKPETPAARHSGVTQRVKNGLNRRASEALQAAQQPKPAQALAVRRALPDGLSDGARILYDRLDEQGVSVDELARMLGIETRDVLCSLTELELYGLASPLPGRRYKRQ